MMNRMSFVMDWFIRRRDSVKSAKSMIAQKFASPTNIHWPFSKSQSLEVFQNEHNIDESLHLSKETLFYQTSNQEDVIVFSKELREEALISYQLAYNGLPEYLDSTLGDYNLMRGNFIKLKGNFGDGCAVINKPHGSNNPMDGDKHFMKKKKLARGSGATNAHTLAATNFPFFTAIHDYFKDAKYVYVVTEFVEGIDLFSVLFEEGNIEVGQCRFYVSQIALAFEYLHSLNIVYRDLKPEKILIGLNGYVKLAYSELPKMINGRTWTLCGAPEYMAPEMLKNREYGLAVDWWALGVVIYEMLVGQTPFYCKDRIEMYERISAGTFSLEPSFEAHTRDLLVNLLQIDPAKRAGNLKEGVRDIKFHPWFEDIDWIRLFKQEIPVYKLPDFERCRLSAASIDNASF